MGGTRLGQVNQSARNLRTFLASEKKGLASADSKPSMPGVLVPRMNGL